MKPLICITASLAVAIFMSTLDTSIVNVALPLLVHVFDTTFAASQWVILGYLLSLASAIVGVGRLGDLFGKKQIYMGGLFVFIISSALCGLAWNVHVLIVFRIMQGLGAAVLMALSFAIAQDAVPVFHITAVMTVLTSMISFGFAVGPTLGGVFIEHFGWASIFYINVPLGIVSILGIWLYLPETKPAKKVEFDVYGTILLAITLICYICAMTESETYGFFSRPVYALCVGTLLALFFFIRRERRIGYPLIQLHVFQDRLLSSSLLTSVLVYANMMCVQLLAAFFLAGVNGFSELQIGMALSVGPVFTGTLGYVAGALTKYIAARKIMIAGILLMVAGNIAMTTLGASQTIFDFCWRLALINTGLTFFQTPNNIMVMGNAQSNQRGVISALLALGRTLGQITGAAVISSLFALFLISWGYAVIDAPRELLIHSYHLTFYITAAYMVGTVVIAYLGIQKISAERKKMV